MRKAEDMFKQMCEEMPWSFVGKEQISPYIIEVIKLAQIEAIEETCRFVANKAKLITVDSEVILDIPSIIECAEILKSEVNGEAN